MKSKSFLVEKMLATISNYQMIECGQTILVGVSGGHDSVVLLHALASISSSLSIKLHAAHLNHSFRGEESDGDAEYVKELSEQLGIGFTIEKIDVPQYSKDMRLSHEEAARIIRYEFLTKTASSIGANKIALAHTADDQIETSLINYIRGTGIDGLAGIPPVRNQIIRPLIDVRRKDIIKYIKQTGLAPRQDSSNLVPVYTRNRIRLELLPYLRKYFRSDIDESILHLTELSKEDSAYLNLEAEKALADIVIESSKNSVILDHNKFLEYPLSIQRRILRMSIRKIKGNIKDIGYIHIHNIIKLIGENKNFILNLPDNIDVEKIYDKLIVGISNDKQKEISYSHEIKIPGVIEITELGLIVQSAVIDRDGSTEISRNLDCITIDINKINPPLVVRNWLPGDRIQPLGMSGSKKLQDVFSDKKIPMSNRKHIPVVADQSGVIWVAGIIMADFVKVTNSTKKYLQIRII